MFDPLVSLLYITAFFALFFGTVPLAVALALGDRRRVNRIFDMHLQVFGAIISAFIGVLRIFRRKDPPPPPTPPGDATKKLPKE